MSKSKSFKFPTAVSLSRGASGPAVNDLQDFLCHFGYLQRSLPVEHPYSKIQMLSRLQTAEPGHFDDVTVEALKHYQAFHRLPITGRLDEETVAQMSLPRCGFPDIPDVKNVSRFVAQGNKWPKKDLTYGFQNFTPDLSAQDVRTAIAAAFNLWSQVTPLTFREIDISSNPDIRILFVRGDHGDGSVFDGVGNVLAHAFFPPPNGGALAGDTHFDDAETWSVTIPVRGIDLVTVAAHEFGHALGLAHSQVREALMAPTYRGARRFLAQDDINGIRAIYGVTDNNPFSDIATDVYRQDILEAVALKFISGFDDSTFRPLALLTREQLVSMSLEALATIPALNLQLPIQAESKPFPDVDASRWSAAKIAFASRHQIVTGYPNGQFRPTLSVTRGEMMAILRRTAEFAKRRLRLKPQLQQKQTPLPFNDIANHWAKDVIRLMSGYCGVASPLNERGRSFRPRQSAQRNYGAAATLRMLSCVKSEEL